MIKKVIKIQVRNFKRERLIGYRCKKSVLELIKIMKNNAMYK